MKFDKRLIAARWMVAAIVMPLLIVGCGGKVKDEVDNAAEAPAPEIISTSQYLPVDSFDKEGLKLPYVAMLNPYAQQEGRLDKASVASYIEARRAFKSREFAKSTAILEKLVLSDKKLSGPMVMLGDIAYEEKQLEKSIDRYNKAISINPENINAYIRLARVLREKGDFIPAQNTYAKVLSVWKDFPEAHLNLAVLYDLYLNKPQEAQAHMEAFLFLSEKENKKVVEWLEEIRSRTGVKYALEAGRPVEPPASVAGGVE